MGTRNRKRKPDRPLAGGIWHNAQGFTLRDTGRKVRGFPPWRKRTLYEYTADADAPLTLQIGRKCFIRPDRHGETDMGSVPEAAQLVIAKDLHLPSFILHDSAYRERKLYFSASLHGEYVAAPITRYRADWLLGVGFTAAGYPIRGRIVMFFVRAFGVRWPS